MSDEIYLTGNEQLHELTPEMARAILERFLEVERAYFVDLRIPGIDFDHSEASIKALLRWVLDSGSMSSAEGASWPTRLGYYFGECLRAHSDALYWTIGEAGYAFENHPVLAGFKDGMEAPLITVCSNILNSIIEGRSGIERIDTGVSTHFESC